MNPTSRSLKLSPHPQWTHLWKGQTAKTGKNRPPLPWESRFELRSWSYQVGLPLWLSSACNEGDLDLTPGLGRSPGEGKGYPLQYSGLENSMDCIIHGVPKSYWEFLLSVRTETTHVNMSQLLQEILFYFYFFTLIFILLMRKLRFQELR